MRIFQSVPLSFAVGGLDRLCAGIEPEEVGVLLAGAEPVELEGEMESRRTGEASVSGSTGSSGNSPEPIAGCEMVSGGAEMLGRGAG